MKAETKLRETQAKAQLVPGQIVTAGPVCAGEEGDYIWGFIFYISHCQPASGILLVHSASHIVSSSVDGAMILMCVPSIAPTKKLALILSDCPKETA